MGAATRKPYPSDVSDEEWHFVLPYLTLMRADAPQRRHDLRAVFDALRWAVRTGAQWDYLPHEFPPPDAVYQQARRWIAAGVFAAMAHDLRALLRVAAGREPEPSAVILDSRALQSTPMSGERAGYDGAKRKRGSKIHLAVDTLGHLLALRVTPADAQDRAQVAALLSEVQEVTDNRVEVAYVDQGYTGAEPTAEAARRGVELVVVKLPQAKRGFVLLPKRWVVERSFAWLAKFRRLARDYERAPAVLAGLHLRARPGRPGGPPSARLRLPPPRAALHPTQVKCITDSRDAALRGGTKLLAMELPARLIAAVTPSALKVTCPPKKKPICLRAVPLVVCTRFLRHLWG